MSLQLRGVSKHFESSGRVLAAVDNLSLEIGNGRFCTLLGPSGCGKTTLLRLIAGFEQPTSGDISYRGRSLNDVPPYRRGFPMVFQSYALFPHMTVRENVAYGLKVRGLSRATRADQIERALALLGLEALSDRHPQQLSGGQQQRVALARALVLEPEIILLDEPLSNLDAELRVNMRGEIRALQRRLGITAVYVTHDQEEALAISDQIVVMNAGRIEQIGSSTDIFQQPRTEFVARFMGFSNIFPIQRTTPSQIMLLGESYVCIPPTNAQKVVLRSEAIQLSPTHGRHRALVEDATFLGTRTRHVLRLADGTRITIDRTNEADRILAAGDTVYFDVRVERLHFV